MSTPRILLSAVGACAAFLLAAWSAGAGASTSVSAQAAKATTVANPITGEGLPNPAPKVTKNWGQLPAGRKWGTSAGIDIDPKNPPARPAGRGFTNLGPIAPESTRGNRSEGIDVWGPGTGSATQPPAGRTPIVPVGQGR